MGKEHYVTRFFRELITAKSKKEAKEAGEPKSAVIATLKDIMYLLEKLPTGKK